MNTRRMRMIDGPMKEILDKLKKELDAGMHREVCDTPPFWRIFTKVELEFIISYWRDRR